MSRLENKVALITGGASGLGKAMSMLFAKEGAKVIIGDVNEKEGKKVVDKIKEENGEALFIPLDVTQESQWKSAMDKATDTYGQLDVLINNAGIGGGKNIEEISFEDYRKLMSINMDGVFLGNKYAVQTMKNYSKSGSIINMSSIEGLVGDPSLPDYCSSKGGVRMLTKSVALHCGKSGYKIRANSIHPGFIETPMVKQAIDDGAFDKDELDSLHPIGHMGEPNDIAYAALYLASDESKFVTGSEQVVDGGYTAQ